MVWGWVGGGRGACRWVRVGCGRKREMGIGVGVDASGRDCFAAIKEKWMVRDPKLKKVALWTYFKGAKRDPGLDEGATTVAYLPNTGWFWYSPISGDMGSVGIVTVQDFLLYWSTNDHAEIFPC